MTRINNMAWKCGRFVWVAWLLLLGLPSFAAENLVKNPGFEENTKTKGWPDIWMICAPGTRSGWVVNPDKPGEHCAKLERTSEFRPGDSDMKNWTVWIQRDIPLPEGTFEASYSVKGAPGSEYQVVVEWVNDRQKFESAGSGWQKTSGGDWERKSFTFSYKNPSGKAKPYIILQQKSAGVILFDDICVAKPEKETKSGNIVINSSFEYTTNPGLADYWGCPHFGMQDPYWILHLDEWRKNFCVDDTTAYDGKRSFRVTNPLDVPNYKGLRLWSNLLGTKMDRKYVLTAYMKSSPAGMRVAFQGRQFELTSGWQRYTVPFARKSNSHYDDLILVDPLTKGTYWIDAVQLEDGEEATAYAPSTSAKEMDLMASIQGKSVEGLQVPRIAAPLLEDGKIVVDGALDEPCWSKAEKVELVLTDGKRPKESTEARIFYDSRGLYIGVKCADEKAKENNCQYKKRDSMVWNDPSVELFINPEGSGGHYYHLVVNKSNVQYDAAVALGSCFDSSWNGKWQSATKILDGAWSAELFLPFGGFALTPATRDQWGVNICRNNQSKSEYSCWSPTHGGFHSPAYFGKLAMNMDVLSGYFFQCNNARLQFTSPDELALMLTIVNNSKDAGEFDLAVSGGDNDKVVKEQVISLKRGEDKNIRVAGFPSQADKKLSLNVSILSRNDKSLLYSTDLFLTPPSLIDVLCQYSIYTGEKEIIARIGLGISPETGAKGTLTVSICKKGGDQAVATKKINALNAISQVSFPAGLLADGNYVMTACLSDAGGKTIAAATDNFRKLAFQSFETKVDRFRRMVVVDGAPFIPFGPTWESMPTDGIMEHLKENGFSALVCVAGYGGNFGTGTWNTSEIARVVKKAEALGLKLIMYIAGPKPNESGKVAIMDEVINKFGKSNAIVAWHVYDEVFDSLLWGQGHYPYVKEACDTLKEKFPYKIIHVNEDEVGLRYLENNSFAFPGDIVSLDYYACPPNGDLNMTAKLLKKMSDLGRRDGKPVWMYILSGGYGLWMSRELTAREQEFNTYTTLINGATAIFYFADQPRSAGNWEKMRQMSSEIRELTPIVASLQDAPPVTSFSPNIEMMVRKCNDSLYLITVNNTPSPVQAVFYIGSAGKKSRAELMFEGRTLPVEDGMMKDNFQSYQRHVYKITSER